MLVKYVLLRENGEDIEWVAGRDYSYNELVKTESSVCAAEPMDSEDPHYFTLYIWFNR